MRGACGVIADCTDRWEVRKHPSAFAEVLHKQRDDGIPTYCHFDTILMRMYPVFENEGQKQNLASVNLYSYQSAIFFFETRHIAQSIS